MNIVKLLTIILLKLLIQLIFIINFEIFCKIKLLHWNLIIKLNEKLIYVNCV